MTRTTPRRPQPRSVRPHPPDLLDAAEVRAALGISPATYFRWLRDGRLRGVRAGRRWRFARSEVERLLRLGPSDGDVRAAWASARAEAAGRLSSSGRTAADVASLVGVAPNAPDADAVAAMLLAHAVLGRATDLLVAPGAGGTTVRVRIDGVLRPVDPPLPPAVGPDVVASLERIAGLPADPSGPGLAHVLTTVAGRAVDLHASTYPTSLGVALTLRIADTTSPVLRLRDAGWSDPVLVAMLRAVQRPHGVVLVNGPTGCGKTTTLYGMLQELRSPGRVLMTVEDPVEMHLDGVLQACVSPEMGFCDAMRAMLRSGLDVGMVSELRDPDSIRLLFQMAATGHLLLSALHAKDAATAVHRVLEVGVVAPQTVVDTLRAVVDQRLAARSCPSCRELRRPDRADVERLGLPTALARRRLAHNRGCGACGGTGGAGRVPVAEVLEMTPVLADAVRAPGVTVESIAAALPRDRRTIRDGVLARLAAGEVTPSAAADVLGRVG